MQKKNIGKPNIQKNKIMDINSYERVISELYKFSENILEIGKRIEDDRLELFEKSIKFNLSSDYKYLIKKHNRFSLYGTLIYGIDEDLRGSSLDKVYNFEHYEVSNKMPSFFVPFSPDGRGNHYCLDLSRLVNEVSPIVFWQWNCVYENIEDVETCNNNFLDWVQESVIDWLLEDYNYDGSEK
jgi:hypothetical protein